MRTITKETGRTGYALFVGLLFMHAAYLAHSAEQHHSPQSEVAFDRHTIELGKPERQTVLTGFFLRNPVAALAVLHRDSKSNGRLRVFAFDENNWKQRLDSIIRWDLRFVDTVKVASQDFIIAYRDGHLVWFTPGATKIEGQLRIDSSFQPPREQEIPHVDITHDLNGDGRDDIVLPARDGFWIATQSAQGKFNNPVKIARRTDLSSLYGADGYRYRPWLASRIHQADFNHDGGLDLIFWQDGAFHVHLQDHGGDFSSTVRRYPIQGLFTADDPFTLATGQMTGTVLHSITDLNNDKTADLVIASLSGRSISKKRSSYHIHFGIRSPTDMTEFPRRPDLTFQADDHIYIALDLHDLNHDGQPELRFTSIPKDNLTNSLWKRLKGFMGDDIALRLTFYQHPFRPNQPTTTRSIALDGFPSHREPGAVPLDLVLRGATHEQRKAQTIWPRAFNPTLLIGDLTGDGNDDLIISAHPRQLSITLGTSNFGLFSEKRQTIKIAMPHDGEYAWLTDLNQDGRQDILLHQTYIQRDVHGGRIHPPGTESQRLTLLIPR